MFEEQLLYAEEHNLPDLNSAFVEILRNFKPRLKKTI